MSEDGFASILVPIDKIKPPLFQCRIHSLDENLDELVDSIKTVGLLEPLVIRIDSENQPELVIGSRRLKACEKAGLRMVPVVVKHLTDEEALEIEGSENLNRNDLSSEEKTRLVSEWARRGYDANDITSKVHKSYTWVTSFLPTEFKDKVKVEAGKLGGEARAATIIVAQNREQTVKTQDMTQCEYCHIATSDIQTETVNSKPRKLCVRCQGNFVLAPERFTAFFRNVNGESKAAEHEPAPKPLYTEKWEHKLGTMKVQHSKPELDYVQGLRNRNLGQVTTDQVIYVVPTFPDANLELTSGKMAYIYVNMPETHDGKQKDKDDRLQFWLKKKEPDALIINVDLKTGSPKEIVEKLDELEEELKWAK